MKRSDTNVRNPTYTLPTQTLPHNLKPFPLSLSLPPLPPPTTTTADRHLLRPALFYLCRRHYHRPPPSQTYPLFSLPPPPPPTATTSDLSSLLSAAATTDTYRGDFSLPGVVLRAKGLNRIGNLLMPDDNYCKFEDWIIPIFDQMLEEQSTKVF